MEGRIKTTIWMPRDQHDQLVAEADRRGWTMSYVINGLVEKWLEALGSRAIKGGVGSEP